MLLADSPDIPRVDLIEQVGVSKTRDGVDASKASTILETLRCLALYTAKNEYSNHHAVYYETDIH